jgi:hypothetical protein
MKGDEGGGFKETEMKGGKGLRGIEGKWRGVTAVPEPCAAALRVPHLAGLDLRLGQRDDVVCLEVAQEVGDEKGPWGDGDDLQLQVDGGLGLALGLGAVARPQALEGGHVVHLAELWGGRVCVGGEGLREGEGLWNATVNVS